MKGLNMSLIGPYNRQQLIKTLEDANNEFHKTYSYLTLDEFYERDGSAWSASDIIRHLIKSVKPVADAMSLPKLVLWIGWGKAKRPSHQYHEIRQIYQKALSKGINPGRFAPGYEEIPATQAEAEKRRSKILANWYKISDRLLHVLKKWSEINLDKYRLPHPVLGKLTVREIIMFTIYHNLHHINTIQQKFPRKSDEDDELL